MRRVGLGPEQSTSAAEVPVWGEKKDLRLKKITRRARLTCCAVVCSHGRSA